MESKPYNGATADSESVSKEVVEAIHLLAQGKRNMLCLEFAQAVQQFQEACEILGKTYGDLADECADAYYWYGKALLELSRMEGGVIGDAVPAESDESQSEDNDNSEDQDAANDEGGSATGEDETSVLSEDIEDEEADLGETTDQTTETNDVTSSEAGVETSKCTDTKVDKEEETKEANSAASTATAVVQNSAEKCAENPTASTSNSDGPGAMEEEEDDVSNLQLAWEMLELAKVIYGRHSTRDMKLKLADTFLKLGEIGMETEQFDQSISDLTSSLAILRSNLSPEDRHIAETLYQLGLACQLDKRYDDAVKNFNDAITVLESRVELQRGIASGDIQPEIPTESTDGFYSPQELAAREIEEIQMIIPEIRSKIEDVRDECRSEERVRIMMNSFSQHSASSIVTSSFASSSSSLIGQDNSVCQSATTSVGSSSTKDVPVNNISHLIRKKRKEEETGEHPEVKRVCTELVNSATNGETSAVQINGNSVCSTSTLDHTLNAGSSNGDEEK